MKYYHKEIDGLRALAVGGVLIFHGAPGLCPGGFVGVDVFFVISGYLITDIVWSGLQAGTFTISGFYDRRIRRILPALLVMLLATIAASFVWHLPADLKNYGLSLAGTAAGATNIVFARQVGYFDAANELKPLLHTWSLAVEEQFYLLFPLLLIAVHRWARAQLHRVLVAIGVVSLGLCLYRAGQSNTFYLMHFRAWEFTVGSLLATSNLVAIGSRVWREIACVLGIAGIAFSYAVVDDSFEFPGVWTIPSVLGAGLVIYGTRQGDARSGRWLNWTPLRFIGWISYPLYLWHWPVLSFLRYLSIPRMELSGYVLYVAGSLGLAYLTYRFVEKPIRSSASWLPRWQLFTATALALPALLAVGILFAKRGFPQRFSPEVLRLADGAYSFQADINRLGAAEVEPSFALWGDSHGAALAVAVSKAAAQQGKAGYFFGKIGLPPFPGVSSAFVPDGDKFNDGVFQRLLEDKNLKTVIIAARWPAYLEGLYVGFGRETSIVDPSPIFAPPVKKSEMEAAILERVSQTVDRLISAGKRVVIVYGVPEIGTDVPRAAAVLKLRDTDPAHAFVLPVEKYRERQAAANRMLDKISGETIQRVYPARALLRDRGYITVSDGRALYYDDDHLSLEGAALVAREFAPLFADVKTTSVSN